MTSSNAACASLTSATRRRDHAVAEAGFWAAVPAPARWARPGQRRGGRTARRPGARRGRRWPAARPPRSESPPGARCGSRRCCGPTPAARPGPRRARTPSGRERRPPRRRSRCPGRRGRRCSRGGSAHGARPAAGGRRRRPPVRSRSRPGRSPGPSRRRVLRGRCRRRSAAASAGVYGLWNRQEFAHRRVGGGRREDGAGVIRAPAAQGQPALAVQSSSSLPCQLPMP